MNLYQTLGVRKNATPATIKAAYRKLSKRHHPDVGGNTDKFQQIALAYSVLKNTETRASYDRDGSLPKPKPSDREVMIGALAEVYTAYLKSGEAFKTNVDLMKNMRTAVRNHLKQLTEGIDAREQEISALTELKQRIVRNDGGENIFVNITDQQIDQRQKYVDDTKERRRAYEMVIKELEDYDSVVEVVNHMTVTWTSGWGSGTTNSTGY